MTCASWASWASTWPHGLGAKVANRRVPVRSCLCCHDLQRVHWSGDNSRCYRRSRAKICKSALDCFFGKILHPTLHPEHAFAELTDLRFWCIDSWRRCPELRFPQTSWPHLELLPELCHAKIWPKQFSVDPTKLEHNVQMLALVACFAWILALIPLWLQWCPCLIKFKFC